MGIINEHECIHIFCMLYIAGIDFHIRNDIRSKDLGRLLNKLAGMMLFPLCLNNVKQTRNKSFILKFEHGFGSLVPTGSDTVFNAVQFFKMLFDMNSLSK